MNNQRIEYIDLAKGVCIILVVLSHLVPESNNYLEFVYCFRMPLYFCLSGLFYKDYRNAEPKDKRASTSRKLNYFGGGSNFIIKKINKILIPFVAWYLLSYSVYYLGVWAHNGTSSSNFRISDVLFSNDIFNIPIWFLLCLFWSNVLFYIVKQVFVKDKYIGIGVFIFATMGWIMAYNEVFNFLYLGSSLTCLPYFYMGYMLKRTTLLYPSKSVAKDYILIFICVLVGALIAFIPEHPPRLAWYRNIISYGNPLSIYLVGASFVLGIILLCKRIKRIPLVTYLGRYSIIILVTHMLASIFTMGAIDRIVPADVNNRTLYIHALNFVVVLACMFVIIPLCRHFLPHITAQKDVIYKNLIKELQSDSKVSNSI